MAARPPVRRVTQRAIAERLGVRQATVSRVLAGTGPVAEDTCQRVLAAAEALGYRPNLAARGMREGDEISAGVGDQRQFVAGPRVVKFSGRSVEHAEEQGDEHARIVDLGQLLMDMAQGRAGRRGAPGFGAVVRVY